MFCDVTNCSRSARSFKKTPTIQFLRRVECRSRRPRRYVQPSADGTLLVRYGISNGFPDLRAIECPYRGFNHGDRVKSGCWCLCQTLALNPSPLHKDISRGLKKSLQSKLRS
ncbi:LADA_0H09472g1_1 [Lachancea dasiensis]|uniref:LADA_0H09472g1_1 n=1 Tax=Lachancea dasiensis TaxID=1072105 RepID=A0A1G4K2S3_9SACH|nr:LADA_0H09472g1_1 [Lachancea dasiensis]